MRDASVVNYKEEAEIYLRLLDTGVYVKQLEYLANRSKELGVKLSLQTFQKAVSRLKQAREQGKLVGKKDRPDKPTDKKDKGRVTKTNLSELKAAFIASECVTLSEFIKEQDIRNHNYIRRHGKGWAKEKETIRKKALDRTVDILVENEAQRRVRDIFAELLVIQYKLFDALQMAASAQENWKQLQSPYACREAANFVLDAQRAIEKLIPSIRGIEAAKEISAIFDQLSDGTMDVSNAAIELTRMGVNLPRPLELMLAKQTPEPPAFDDGEEITEAEIIAKQQELIEANTFQRIHLIPERLEYVKSVKAELKDSFAEQKRADDET